MFRTTVFSSFLNLFLFSKLVSIVSRHTCESPADDFASPVSLVRLFYQRTRCTRQSTIAISSGIHPNSNRGEENPASAAFSLRVRLQLQLACFTYTAVRTDFNHFFTDGNQDFFAERQEFANFREALDQFEIGR